VNHTLAIRCFPFGNLHLPAPRKSNNKSGSVWRQSAWRPLGTPPPLRPCLQCSSHTHPQLKKNKKANISGRASGTGSNDERDLQAHTTNKQTNKGGQTQNNTAQQKKNWKDGKK